VDKMNPEKLFKVLSIDAWKHDGGWDWNQWFNINSKCPESLLKNNRKLLNWFRKEGILSKESAGRVSVEDDGYNVVIMNKSTREPLYAVEYGSEQ